MSRLDWLLVLIILAGLSAIGWKLSRQLEPAPLEPQPYLPKNNTLDSLTRKQLQARIANLQKPEDWQKLAEAYWVCGYLPEAEACFREAARQGLQDVAMLTDWAFCLTRLGRLEESNETYRRAIQLKQI